MVKKMSLAALFAMMFVQSAHSMGLGPQDIDRFARHPASWFKDKIITEFITLRSEAPYIEDEARENIQNHLEYNATEATLKELSDWIQGTTLMPEIKAQHPDADRTTVERRIRLVLMDINNIRNK